MGSHRGTTNGNCRGNWLQRKARRARLLEAYACDKVVLRVQQLLADGTEQTWQIEVDGKTAETTAAWLRERSVSVISVEILPAVRCYRCGTVLTEETLTIDRIKPGIEGGTYADENIRPACGGCNSSTGAALGHARRKAS